jgi:hypothetical protein
MCILIICLYLCRTWDLVLPGDSRRINGILGALVREHFPGIVQYQGRNELAYTFSHYAEADDDEYDNKAERVKAEFWVSLLHTKLLAQYITLVNICFPNNAWIHRLCMQRFFQPMAGTEAACAETLVAACRKRVTDMHYDVKARQAIAYYASKRGEKLDPAQAKRTTLSFEQYMQVHEEYVKRFLLRLCTFNLLLYVKYLMTCRWCLFGALVVKTPGR